MDDTKHASRKKEREKEMRRDLVQSITFPFKIIV